MQSFERLGFSIKLLSTFIFLFFTVSNVNLSQTVTEPVTNKIYEFIDNLAIKGVIEFNSNIRPLTREYLAIKLHEIASSKEKLSNVEKDQLEFYLRDFGFELEKSDSAGYENFSWFKDKFGRHRFFTFQNEQFLFKVDPIIGYSIGRLGSDNYFHQWSGLSFYGNIGSNLGFRFNFRDNMESSGAFNTDIIVSPKTGIIPTSFNEEHAEYSEVRAELTYSWQWGNLSIGKDFFYWGHGLGGQLVNSTNAPSFPFIRLYIYPTEWLRFNYLHGWLNSNLTDSIKSYPSKKVFREKFIASHSISIIPFRGLELSMGESIVYSDKIEVSYLIPIMFFRLADHYLANATDVHGGNAQFFFSFSAKNIIPKTNLYADLILDDLSIRRLFTHKNKFGYTVGISTYSLPIENMKLWFEYTKIRPFVYEHNILGQNYKSDDDDLGHWIGHNAELLYLGIQYYFIRGLSLKAWFSMMRKGTNLSLSELQSLEQPEFLSGDLYKSNEFGAHLVYEFFHDLFVSIEYRNFSYIHEQNENSTKKLSRNELFFSVNYGF